MKIALLVSSPNGVLGVTTIDADGKPLETWNDVKVGPGLDEVVARATPEIWAGLVQDAGKVLTRGVTPLDQLGSSDLAELRRLEIIEGAHVVEALMSIHQSEPSVPCCLLSNSAFFSGMPAEAAEYALPSQLRRTGIRRAGIGGLSHEWALGTLDEHGIALPGRVVSVDLGEVTTVAAIRNGRAVECSGGFTPVEGIPSLTACGDIDPTIVLHLRGSGMALFDVNRVLAEESGLRALAGREVRLADLVGDAPPTDVLLARSVYEHHLVRAIGAAIAVLGGVELVVYTSPRPPEPWRSFITRINGRMKEILGESSILEPAADPPIPTESRAGATPCILLSANIRHRHARLISRAITGGIIHA